MSKPRVFRLGDSEWIMDPPWSPTPSEPLPVYSTWESAMRAAGEWWKQFRRADYREHQALLDRILSPRGRFKA